MIATKSIERVNTATKVNIPELVHQVSCGSECTMCLTEQNLYAWGAHLGLVTPMVPNIIPNLTGKVDNMCASKDHFFSWSSETGQVYVWGHNHHGKLGIEGDTQQPTLIEIFSEASHYGWKLTKVAAGLDHSVALVEVDDDIKIFVWGSNKDQQLGFDASEESIQIPHQVEVELLNGITDIYAKHNYTMALNQDGNVFSWGSDEFGRLGKQTLSKHVKLPSQIQALSGYKIILLALGTYHIVAIDQEGRAFSWGRGLQGQLAHGNGSDSNKPRQIQNIPQILSAGCGEAHTLLLTYSRDVMVCGSNQYGQLGLGDYKSHDTLQQALTGMKQVHCGRFHSVTLSEDGSVYAFGSNEFGQLGVSSSKTRTGSAAFSTPVVEHSEQKQQYSAHSTEVHKQVQLKQENQELKQRIRQLEINQEQQSYQQAELFEEANKLLQYIEQIGEQNSDQVIRNKLIDEVTINKSQEFVKFQKSLSQKQNLQVLLVNYQTSEQHFQLIEKMIRILKKSK